MTIEEALQLSEVMKAYSEGKTIQVKSEGRDPWVDVSWTLQTVNTGRYKYRIKPEEPKPRPYANAKEFLDAQKEHGPYLIPDKSDKYVLPTQINQDGLGYVQEYNQMGWYNVFRFYKWQDGTPCGILEE